jgi:hypothetical protein
MVPASVAALFIIACIFAGWMVAVPLGIALVAYWGRYETALLGGALMDILYGAPMSFLAGFPVFYTSLFMALSAIAYFLRRTMID